MPLPLDPSRKAALYNEEASLGGLVCGLRRRVYQDSVSGVHSLCTSVRRARSHPFRQAAALQDVTRSPLTPYTWSDPLQPSGTMSPSPQLRDTPSRGPSHLRAYRNVSTPHDRRECKC